MRMFCEKSEAVQYYNRLLMREIWQKAPLSTWDNSKKPVIKKQWDKMMQSFQKQIRPCFCWKLRHELSCSLVSITFPHIKTCRDFQSSKRPNCQRLFEGDSVGIRGQCDEEEVGVLFSILFGSVNSEADNLPKTQAMANLVDFFGDNISMIVLYFVI